MKINDIEVDDAAVLALLTDEQKAKLTEAKGETDFILYKPEKSERFFYLDSVWERCVASWSDTLWESKAWNCSIIAPYTTEGRRYLERKQDQHLAKVRLQRWIAVNATQKINWDDETQHKYVPMYDVVSKKIVLYNYITWMANPDGIYVTKADRGRFLKECEDDLKIYFGVK